MRRRILTALIGLNIVATALAAAWALLWLALGRLALYDTNVETFKFALTEEQGTGLLNQMQSLLKSVAVPLLLTNGCWVILVLVLLRRRSGGIGGAQPEPVTQPARGAPQ